MSRSNLYNILCAVTLVIWIFMSIGSFPLGFAFGGIPFILSLIARLLMQVREAIIDLREVT